MHGHLLHSFSLKNQQSRKSKIPNWKIVCTCLECTVSQNFLGPYENLHMHAHTYTDVCKYVCVCVHAYMCVCVCVCTVYGLICNNIQFNKDWYVMNIQKFMCTKTFCLINPIVPWNL
jgi:hypothetical protein